MRGVKTSTEKTVFYGIFLHLCLLGYILFSFILADKLLTIVYSSNNKLNIDNCYLKLLHRTYHTIRFFYI